MSVSSASTATGACSLVVDCRASQTISVSASPSPCMTALQFFQFIDSHMTKQSFCFARLRLLNLHIQIYELLASITYALKYYRVTTFCGSSGRQYGQHRHFQPLCKCIVLAYSENHAGYITTSHCKETVLMCDIAGLHTELYSLI